MEPIKVSVVVVTYNHEKYIADALNSILAQKIDFRIEVIVADDGSTDNTPKIVDEFAEKHPGVIIPYRSAQNKGVYQNSFTARFKMRGQYGAILDGDDYWDYNLKLQKQVEFLDANPDYNGVFHDAKIIHVDDSQDVLFSRKRLYSQNYTYKEVIYPSDFIKREMILPSSSTLLRMSGLDGEDISLINDNYSFLWKLCCFAIKRAKFYFINEPWSVYRNHQEGVSKRDNYEFHSSHIRFLEGLLKEEFYIDYPYDIYQAIVNEYTVLLNSKSNQLKNKKKSIFRQYVWYEVCRIRNFKKRVIIEADEKSKDNR